MKVLTLIHAESEGAGTIGEYLQSIGASVRTVKLFLGEPVPQDPLEWDAIISMGGPMNVYEEEQYSFLRDETQFLRNAIEAEVRVLGICLGSQMIAKALGAAVSKAPVKEKGWCEVTLTGAGGKDPLFKDVPPRFTVLQWHEDTFAHPRGATLLATAPSCVNQAFRYKKAVGLQFHIEVNRAILSDWVSEEETEQMILGRFDDFNPGLAPIAWQIYENFFAKTRRRRRSATDETLRLR